MTRFDSPHTIYFPSVVHYNCVAALYRSRDISTTVTLATASDLPGWVLYILQSFKVRTPLADNHIINFTYSSILS